MNQLPGRKHYIDNLRAFSLLLVFVFHIFRVYSYSLWDDKFYIYGEELLITSVINVLLAIWLMPLLFAVAGISSRYALTRRSAGEYAKERAHKLLLPFVFGLLFIVPIQPYLAGLFRGGEANYLDSFTMLTDFSGYDGAFSIAHLWFLIFLFVISMVSLPLMKWYESKGKGTLGNNVPLILIILMGLLPVMGSFFDVFGKRPAEYLAYFLLGYFFLSNDDLLEKLEKYRFLLLGLFVVYTSIMLFVFNGEFYEAASWLAILTLLGMGRHYLNFSGKITDYLSKSSFGVYIFHQSWIVVAAFFVLRISDNWVMQIPLIFLSAIPLTYLSYEICRRLSITRWMFGLKR